MTECNGLPLEFASAGRRKIQADFAGGDLTSDAGLLLLREVDRRLGLIDALNAAISDPRFQPLVVHDQRTLLAQRVFALAGGYEDLNDHHTLRNDTLLQALTERQLKVGQAEGDPLSSPPTLCRLENPRFVVTSLPGDPQALYDALYCQRGDAENRIKEQQLGLFADRTSCHAFLANQFRVLLSAATYVLVETLRRVGLAGTDLAAAQVTTIRLKLLKLGGRIVRSVRRLVLHLASGCPLQAVFQTILRNLRQWRCIPTPSP